MNAPQPRRRDRAFTIGCFVVFLATAAAILNTKPTADAPPAAAPVSVPADPFAPEANRYTLPLPAQHADGTGTGP
jgi:hypothetical protein